MTDPVLMATVKAPGAVAVIAEGERFGQSVYLREGEILFSATECGPHGTPVEGRLFDGTKVRVARFRCEVSIDPLSCAGGALGALDGTSERQAYEG